MDEKAVESKLTDVLNDIFKVDAVQETLYNVLEMNCADKCQTKVNTVCLKLQSILSESSPNSEPQSSSSQESSSEGNPRLLEVGSQALVQHLSTKKNPAQAQLICFFLQHLAKNKVVPAKIICNSLLTHENLKPENCVFWLSSFHVIKSIISGVDYKGVREIMKNCLERARLLPVHLHHSHLAQANALCDLLELIFDRSASLLPGYFIVNELLKLYPDYKDWPHWCISKMLTDFVDNFRKAAQMLSIVGRPSLRPVVEHSGHSSPSINSWKLDCATLKFPLKGALPYWECLQEPQPLLLKYVLRQPYSREMVCTMLDLQKKKQRYEAVEEQLTDLIIESLEECSVSSTYSGMNSGSDLASGGSSIVGGEFSPCACSYTSALLIYFILNQLISFQMLVQSLHEKLKSRPLARGGRDDLMWVLLQFLSGTIQKNPVSDFQPVLRLIEFLYDEDEPLPVPDCSDPRCAFQLSAMCILIHILRKAQLDNLKTPHSLPPAFTSHNELLQSLLHNPQAPLLSSGFLSSTAPDYRIALLLNAYSTNQEVFHRPIWALSEVIQGSQKSTVPMPGINCVALGSTTPLSVTLLDSLTIHVKMSLIHNITQHITKHAHSKSTVALAPALIETYARLFVYTETESIGIKQYITNLLPVVYKSQVWGILHALIEMFTYRVHHSPPHYRVQLLSTIHHMTVPLNTMPNMNQLHLCMENGALRLITGLGNSEVLLSLSRFFNTESKPNVISSESEELNRVIVLTMARAIHITGVDSSGDSARWCIDFLKAVMTHTPHSWAPHTLQCFPAVIADFYKQCGSTRDTQSLKKAVEEEYRKWKSMSNENDIIAHFSLQHNSSTLFLCLLFKMVLETDRVPVEAYKVLERLGPRQLMAHVRTLCDFLVLEFSHSSLGQHLTKCVDTMNAIIWTYNIVPIDRLILCLALRTQEGSSEAQVCLFIIQLLLLRPADFRNRVQEFVNENAPDHWRQSNWYEKHMAFHRKFPEKFAPESHMAGQGSLSSQYQTLPIYFTNVCLRFIPVLDIMIHRFLEVYQVHKRLETLLEQLGTLYKFHSHPITYLYNTLHYYEKYLRESTHLKRQLVGAVIMSQRDCRPPGWALTDDFISYLNQSSEEISWNPGLSYYLGLVKRMVYSINGKKVFPPTEWRFNEFSNVGVHALHITCVELMALPVNPSVIANNLLDTVLKGYCEIPMSEVQEYINAVGLILTWLPESYWIVVHERILLLLQCTELTVPSGDEVDPFTLMDFQKVMPSMGKVGTALTISLIHSFWHHASFGQISRIPQLMRDCIRPVLRTEEQLIVLCHLVGPFLQRINTEVARKVFDITIELYQALAVVDQQVEVLKYQDPICDLLYHIKYMFTGDSIKNDLEGIIRGLRPSLQLRLRFITHLNIEAIESSGSSSSCSVNSTGGTLVGTCSFAQTTSSATLASSTTVVSSSSASVTAVTVTSAATVSSSIPTSSVAN